MKTEMIEIGPLSTQITITLGPEDYKDKFESELKKYKDKSHLKGFRKGKTPMSAIRKMFGKTVLAEIINEKLQSGLNDYITEQKIDILGNPLPAEDQEQIDFDLKDLGEYSFQFDLGLAPSFDVKGVASEDVYTRYAVTVGDELVTEQMDNLLRRMGTQEDTDEPAEDLDILTVYAVEKEGAEREVYTTEFSIMVDRMSEQYRETFLGKKKGYQQDVEIFEFEKDASEDYVRKYLIKDAPEDVNPVFEIEIKAVKRLVPADLNEETLEKIFGKEGIKDEAGARAKIREDLETHYDEQAKALTQRDILEKLVEKNEVELPLEFLKRWLKTSNPDVEEIQLEKEFDGFVKNLRWTLIKSQLAEKYEIKIEPGDIREALMKKVRKQFAAYHYEGLNYEQLVEGLMKKQDTVQKEYEELLASSVLDRLMSEVIMEPKAVSIDEFKSLVESMQQNFG